VTPGADGNLARKGGNHDRGHRRFSPATTSVFALVATCPSRWPTGMPTRSTYRIESWGS